MSAGNAVALVSLESLTAGPRAAYEVADAALTLARAQMDRARAAGTSRDELNALMDRIWELNDRATAALNAWDAAIDSFEVPA